MQYDKCDWYDETHQSYESGCCLICDSAEEGCLCFNCKCRKCFWYERDDYEDKGYCEKRTYNPPTKNTCVNCNHAIFPIVKNINIKKRTHDNENLLSFKTSTFHYGYWNDGYYWSLDCKKINCECNNPQ